MELHPVLGAVEFADLRGVLPIENDDGRTVSECILYTKPSLSSTSKSATGGLRRLGIRKLVAKARKLVGVLLCGDGTAEVTVSTAPRSSRRAF